MNKPWTPSNQTDIRKTWLLHWPKKNRDAVWERISASVNALEKLPVAKMERVK